MFKLEAILDAEGEVWGYEVLLDIGIPNGVLFAAPNPKLDLYLVETFCEALRARPELRKIRYTANVTIPTVAYYSCRLNNVLAAHGNLFLEIVETHAAASPMDIEIAEAFARSWPRRVLLDDFLQGGLGFALFRSASDVLAGLKLNLKDLDLALLSPTVRDGLMVVVERVETPEDLEQARLKGGTHYQGFLFGKPRKLEL